MVFSLFLFCFSGADILSLDFVHSRKVSTKELHLEPLGDSCSIFPLVSSSVSVPVFHSYTVFVVAVLNIYVAFLKVNTQNDLKFFSFYSLCLLYLKEVGPHHLSLVHDYFPSSLRKYFLWKTTFGKLKIHQ